MKSTSLVPGTNVLAVELHQATTNSSDAAFALEMRAGGWRYVPPNPPAPPQIRFNLGSDGSFLLTFPELNGRAYVIEASQDLGAWTILATNAVQGGIFQLSAETSAAPYQFFRARWPP